MYSSVPPPLHTLKIWGAGSTPRGARRPSLSVCMFVCPSRYDARHRKPRRFVYALNLGGGGGHKHPGQFYLSFQFSFSFSF